MAFGVLGRQWIVWKAAWEAESDQPPNRAVPEGPAAEFLPEALDMQETPPSPIGRSLLWTILVACAIGAAWVMLMRIDSVTTAHGTVVPGGDWKRIHLSEAGVLTAIHVHDGQPVKQGDVLIEVDPMRKIVERERAGKDYRAIRVEAARLRALIKHQAILEAPADADGDDIRFQQRLLRDQLAGHQAKMVEAQSLVEQRRETVVQAKDALLRIKMALSRETERAERSKALMEHGIGAKTDFLQAEHRRSETRQEVMRRQEQLEQDRAALAEAEQESRTLVSNFQQATQAELSALEAKAALLAQVSTQSEREAGVQRVRSPIDGVVRQFGVPTVGSAVTPAQPVLTIVPLDHSVKVEAHVERKDVGAVHRGQPVEITFEAFQAVSSGPISGHVLTVPDAAESSKTKERIVPLQVGLDRSTIRVGNTEATLTPGMAVTVEIKTGPRRMSEHLLEPVFQAMDERVREWNAFVYAVRGFIERRNRS